MEIAYTLRVARARNNLKQYELAWLVRVTGTAISQIENGHTRPYKGTRNKIESVLGKIDWDRTYSEGIIHRKKRRRRRV